MPDSYGHRSRVLDGVRGLAVLMVVLSHLSNHHASILYLSFSGVGRYGVYLFFALSAYLLTNQFLSRDFSVSFSRYELLNYFFRRFLRIYPMYLAVLGVSWLTTRYLAGDGFPYDISSSEFIDHLLLLQGKSVLWSIPVEFKYYFLLPLVCAALFLARRRLWLVIALAFAALALTYWLPVFADTEETSIDLMRYLPVFISGSVCALLVRDLDVSRVPVIWFRALTYGCLLVTLLLFPSILHHLLTKRPAGLLIHSMPLWGVIFAGLIFACMHADTWVKRALCSGPMTYLGKISFSVYLLHVPIIRLVLDHVSQPWIGGYLALVSAILAASATYFLIERPLFRLRLSDVSPRSVPAADATGR